MKIAVVFGVGAIMGFLSHISANKGKIVKVRNLKNHFDPGFLRDMLFGGAAAIAMFFISDPGSTRGLIASAISAGWAGEKLLSRIAVDYKTANFKQVDDQLDTPIEDDKTE